MLKSSIKFNEAFEKNVRKVYARVTIGDKSFTEADIFTIDFESGSVNGPGYQIGSVFSDLVKIKFDKVIRDLKELDKVIVETGIEREQIEDKKQPLFNSKVRSLRIGQGKLNKMFYDNPIEYVRLGTFYISEHADINENDNTTTITCMDAIIYFEQPYKPTIKFPADIFDVSVDIAGQVGVQINTQSFSSLPNKTIKLPEQMTARQLIGYIAQFACGFIKISKFGVLELKTPKSTEKIIDSSLYYQKGLSKNDLKYRIDGILNRNQITSKEIISGKTSGSQLVIENPFIEQSDLDKLFNLVKNVEYYPFTLQWYGLPSIEAGDWLIIEDIDNNQYRVPNLSYKLHYNGGLKATSSAETQSQSSELNIFEGPLNREIVRLNKEVTSNKENSITKEDIIEKINLSEESLDGKPLQISGNKVTINNYTKIEDGSVKDEAIESLNAKKIKGNTSGNKMDIDFDNESIKFNKPNNSLIEFKNGDLFFDNYSDLYQKINSADVIDYRKVDLDIVLNAINSTDVYMFDGDKILNKLGLIDDIEINIDNLFKTDDGNISLTQVVMSLLVAVKNLNSELEKIKRGD
ncbi:hypothetical protein [Vagococcus hydrophili]|uniref:Peptidase S74 domain-containing protein n=1 Tax=Vagococcus hydrophili TaxID=2714947 RepID=A0A6G8APY3_9ENTE|nr:hypothetical protein [Vagococcus hydrophili]QIL47029.1 hypothetical protein G7082_00030 [Vagococcus hydrophili]